MENFEDEYSKITEGSSHMFVNKNEAVFYNKAQIVNRDLSISIIKTYIELIKAEKNTKYGLKENQEVLLIEAMAASGLRSIRYFKEISGIDKIIVNDIDPKSIVALKKNIESNGLSEEVLIPNLSNCIDCLKEQKIPPNIIDIDPYGSASLYIGSEKEACWAKYNSQPVKSRYCHEMALRILLGCIESHANRHKRYIVPLVSLSVDFYVRVFIRVYCGAQGVRLSSSKQGWLFQCTGCDSFAIMNITRTKSDNKNNVFPNTGPPVSKNCQFCNSPHHMGGPIWTYPIHDISFLSKCLNILNNHNDKSIWKYPLTHHKRVLGLISMASKELPEDPLYYDLASLSNTLHCREPSLRIFCSALLNSGYNASRTHCKPGAIKTNAPVSLIWNIMKEWIKIEPIKPPSIMSPAYNILNKSVDMENIINLKEHKNVDSVVENLPTFLPTPVFWGPLSRPSKKNKKKRNPPRKKQKADD